MRKTSVKGFVLIERSDDADVVKTSATRLEKGFEKMKIHWIKKHSSNKGTFTDTLSNVFMFIINRTFSIL